MCAHITLGDETCYHSYNYNNTVDQDDPKVTNIATPRRMIFAAADDLFAAEAITQSENERREREESAEREKGIMEEISDGGGMAVMSHKN